jgi:hypothetical protein
MENIKSFLNKINSDNAGANPEPKFDLLKSITKELNSQEVYNKLLSAKQEKIKVKEVILESEIDFIASAKKLKNVFENQLYEAIEKVTDIYNRELLNLQSYYRNKLAGEGLMTLIKALNESEYSIVMMNSRIYAYKYYDPFHEVKEGQFQSGVTFVYEKPVCLLKGVYVNLLHPKIINGSILISTDSRHPNANASGLTEVCVGNLEDRKIPLENTESLIDLLNSVCSTYEVCHLDSAYFIPEHKYSTKEGALKWTA